jgi:hypothetical protein
MSGQGGTSALARFSDAASIVPIDAPPIDKPACLNDCPVTLNVAPRLHVNAGIAYVIPDPSPSNVPIYAYRLP